MAEGMEAHQGRHRRPRRKLSRRLGYPPRASEGCIRRAAERARAAACCDKFVPGDVEVVDAASPPPTARWSPCLRERLRDGSTSRWNGSPESMTASDADKGVPARCEELKTGATATSPPSISAPERPPRQPADADETGGSAPRGRPRGPGPRPRPGRDPPRPGLPRRNRLGLRAPRPAATYAAQPPRPADALIGARSRGINAAASSPRPTDEALAASTRAPDRYRPLRGPTPGPSPAILGRRRRRERRRRRFSTHQRQARPERAGSRGPAARSLTDAGVAAPGDGRRTHLLAG